MENRIPTVLKLTGERTLPDIKEENYWFQRHLFAYEYLSQFAKNMVVLDAGCGEGYGANLLASVAKRVIAIDIFSDAIEHARLRYIKENLEFILTDVNSLLFLDSTFDMAVSLQVIEHLPDHNLLLQEIFRVLKEGSTAFLTTPNKETSSPKEEKPSNPFHYREFTPAEFQEILNTYFKQVEIRGVFHHKRIMDNLPIMWAYFQDNSLPPEERKNKSLYLDFITSLNTRDFYISQDNIEKSIDLLAICKK